MKKQSLTLVALALAGLALGSGGLAVADGARHEPDPKTIVEVGGDPANGFSIYYHDGTSEFPPTDSEALAECSEYDTRVARVRCRTEVRVWYRDLGDLKRSINYQQALQK